MAATFLMGEALGSIGEEEEEGMVEEDMAEDMGPVRAAIQAGEVRGTVAVTEGTQAILNGEMRGSRHHGALIEDLTILVAGEVEIQDGI